jgi:histidinol-phosphate aminotransferase
MSNFIRQALEDIKDYIPGKNPTKPGMIKLASNENPFGPSPKALKAIVDETRRLHIYPDQKSILLRDALSKKLSLPGSQIIIGNGSDEIMQIVACTVLNPGEEVIIPKNTFSLYEFVARLMAGLPVLVDLKNYEQDLDSMARAVTPKTKIIFLCNPHNPSGTYINQAKLNAFLASVPNNVLVIIDEAYAEFSDAKDFPDAVSLVKKHENILVLRTFSKYYGLAGLRVGYGLANENLVKYLFRAKLPFNVSRLAQAGALASLDDKAYLEKTYKNNIEGKTYLYQEFGKMGLAYLATQSNFIFIDIKQEADGCFLEMLKKGVIIRPLTSFGLPNAIRVSIGTKEHSQKLISALKS